MMMTSTDDDIRFEEKIRDFNLVKAQLGPLTVRYAINGGFRGREYNRMLVWTGDSGKGNPARRLQDENSLVEELEKHVVDYMQMCPEVEKSRQQGGYPVTIISPPKNCLEGAECSGSSQRNHLGYMVGAKIAQKLKSLQTPFSHAPLLSVGHLLSMAIFHCNFPTVKRRSWSEKANMKYLKWIPRENPPVEDRIRNSDTIIIIDDTMVSYMGMMRISLAIRKINPECKILWAAVFGVTGQRYRDDSPIDLLPILDEHW